MSRFNWNETTSLGNQGRMRNRKVGEGKMRPEGDFERHQTYNAEDDASRLQNEHIGSGDLTPRQVKELVAALTNDEIFAGITVKVKFGGKGRASGGIDFNRGGKRRGPRPKKGESYLDFYQRALEWCQLPITSQHFIKLAPRFRTKWVICHELAHVWQASRMNTDQYGYIYHDGHFRACLLHILERLDVLYPTPLRRTISLVQAFQAWRLAVSPDFETRHGEYAQSYITHYRNAPQLAITRWA